MAKIILLVATFAISCRYTGATIVDTNPKQNEFDDNNSIGVGNNQTNYANRSDPYPEFVTGRNNNSFDYIVGVNNETNLQINHSTDPVNSVERKRYDSKYFLPKHIANGSSTLDSHSVDDRHKLSLNKVINDRTAFDNITRYPLVNKKEDQNNLSTSVTKDFQHQVRQQRDDKETKSEGEISDRVVGEPINERERRNLLTFSVNTTAQPNLNKLNKTESDANETTYNVSTVSPNSPDESSHSSSSTVNHPKANNSSTTPQTISDEIEDKQAKDVTDDDISLTTTQPSTTREIPEVFTEYGKEDILQSTREPFNNNNNNNSNVRYGNETLKSASGNSSGAVKVKGKLYGQVCLNCTKADAEGSLKSADKVFGVKNVRESETIKNVSSLEVIIKERMQSNLNDTKKRLDDMQTATTATTTTELDYIDLINKDFALTPTSSGDIDENFTVYFANGSYYENGSDGGAARMIQEFPWPVKKEAVVEGDIVLGGLMMVHEREDTITCGPVMPQGGIQALEAMLYTLDRLNESPTPLLPNITLGAHILDDCDKDTYGLEMAVDFIKGTWTSFISNPYNSF